MLHIQDFVVRVKFQSGVNLHVASFIQAYIVKGGLISDSVFTLVHPQKNVWISALSLNFLFFVEISHFFEDETKVKRPSEIKPPLTCRVVLLLNRKIILAWESKISLVPNCLVNCLLIVCVMNLVMDRKINFVFNSANILRL